MVTIDTVGLIVNNNNPITPPEIDAWRNLRDATDPGKRINSNFIYPIKDPNNQNQGISNLLTSIRNANPQPIGIVVSSDAYLREVGDVDFDAQLRDASPNKGGHFNGWVCYPYKEYVLAPGANSIYSTTTPVLATDDPTYTMAAYYQLGITAATILDQLVSGTSPANAGLTTWNGSQWNPPDLMFP